MLAVLLRAERAATLIQQADTWTVGALTLLRGLQEPGLRRLAERLRGGPTFPGMFIGAVGGMALSHLPGLPMIAGVGMGIGAMTVAMLGFPLTSVLIVAVLLQADGSRCSPL